MIAPRKQRTIVPGPSIERLLARLFEDVPEDAFVEELRGWVAGSPRFRAFINVHQDKVRKKLRGAADHEARRDVRTELRIAHFLLADRRIALAYEAYGSGRAGPDFTITFRGARSFNLEVTRMRRMPDRASLGGSLLTKLRQLPTGASNLLLVAIDGERPDRLDVASIVRSLRGRADRKDQEFLAAHGFDGTRRFYDHFLRLGGVLVWCETPSGDAGAALWTNPSARITLPAEAARACLASLRIARSP